VRSGIDFDHIQRTAAVARKIYTAWADATRSVSWALETVEATGQDSGRGGLSAAARAAEKVGVINAVIAKRGHQRSSDLRLPNEFREGLWAIATIKGGDHD